MEKRLIIKEDGKTIKKLVVNEEAITKMNGLNRYVTNPCGDCKNCYASECPKVFDESKDKDIRKYDFITDGFQINDVETGELDNLVVGNCAKFEKDYPRKKASTLEEIKHLNHLKESIKILFFDAGDLDEADDLQTKLFRR